MDRPRPHHLKSRQISANLDGKLARMLEALLQTGKIVFLLMTLQLHPSISTGGQFVALNINSVNNLMTS